MLYDLIDDRIGFGICQHGKSRDNHLWNGNIVGVIKQTEPIVAAWAPICRHEIWSYCPSTTTQHATHIPGCTAEENCMRWMPITATFPYVSKKCSHRFRRVSSSIILGKDRFHIDNTNLDVRCSSTISCPTFRGRTNSAVRDNNHIACSERITTCLQVLQHRCSHVCPLNAATSTNNNIPSTAVRHLTLRCSIAGPCSGYLDESAKRMLTSTLEESRRVMCTYPRPQRICRHHRYTATAQCLCKSLRWRSTRTDDCKYSICWGCIDNVCYAVG